MKQNFFRSLAILGILVAAVLCVSAKPVEAAKTGFCKFTCDNGLLVPGGQTLNCDPSKGDGGYNDCEVICNADCGARNLRCGKAEDIQCSSVESTPTPTPTQPVATTPAKTSGGAQGIYGLYDPFAGATIPQIMGNVVKLLLGLVGVIFLVMFLWGGFIWLTAGGESKKVETAQNILKNAIFGLVAVIASYTVLSILISLASLLQSK